MKKFIIKLMLFVFSSTIFINGNFALALGQSSVSLKASKSAVSPREIVRLEGLLNPLHQNAKVDLLVWENNNWKIINSTVTNAQSEFVFEASPSGETFYTAIWNGDSDHRGSFAEAIMIAASENSSSITLNPDRKSINSGETVNFSGVLSPAHPNIDVSFQRWNGKEWQILNNAKTNSQSQFGFTDKPSESAFYTSVWAGDNDHEWNYSDPLLIEVVGTNPGGGNGGGGDTGNGSTNIKMVSNATEFKRGSDIILKGNINPSHQNTDVWIYSWNGSSWINFKELKTNTEGNFSHTFKAQASGSYVALWAGDDDHPWGYSEYIDIVVADNFINSGKVPWSGWWWPFLSSLGPTMYDAGGPLAKYDQYVLKTTGSNPNSRGWEAKNHATTDPSATWWGHCHAWAAASILEPDPKTPKTKAGVTFSVGDQKGLLAEVYWDPVATMWGDRYGDGIGSEDINDIKPALFNSIIHKYMRDEKKALIFDLDPGWAIWNFPAYKFAVDKTEDGSGKSIYETTVWFSNFTEPSNNNHLETTRTYKYWISGSQSGWIGESIKDHPDFIWLPTGRHPHENKAVSYEKVKEIVK